MVLSGWTVVASESTTFNVQPLDIQAGYIAHRIYLHDYAVPTIEISGVTYSAIDKLPEDAFPSSVQRFDVLMGLDRKKPFAIVRIPAFSVKEDGTLQQVTGLTIKYTENTVPEPVVDNGRGAAKTTADVNSPLATGTWYKVSVPSTGLYKVDYNFLSTQLGVTGIPSSQIRVFGHGGKMLPEQNPQTGVKGLTENAIWVNDGGDGKFDPGDYFVFYAQGPVNWVPNSDRSMLVQEKNYYADKGYYLLNFDAKAEKRVTTQINKPSGNLIVNTYSGAVLHEEDLANPQNFGKRWWGEEFSSAPGKENTHSFTLDIGSMLDTVEFRTHVVNTSTAPGIFTLSLDGKQMSTLDVSATNNYDYAPKAMGQEAIWRLPHPGKSATITITYNTNSSEGSGWLDYIRVNGRRPLSVEGNSNVFCDLNSVGAGNVATYRVSNAGSGTQVWDVTDPQNPVRMDGNLVGGNVYEFVQDASSLHRFAVVNDAGSLDAPEFVATVPNQNLYGSAPVDFIIVTHPDFKTAAEKLAEFHRKRSGMRVIVATTTQVYNEFSSAGQDISAIRDFARMFYERAGMNDADMPRYLLLLGDASYDYKDRIKSNTNFVPTFEALESFDFLNTYSNDDFFGFLDAGENIERYDIVNALDIGVGRIPAKSAEEADRVVDKIIHYKSPATLGAWRLNALFVADNEDAAGEHLDDAETMVRTVAERSNIHNPVKVYEDAIQFISTPGGQRAPDANKAINDGIFKGLFMFNYNGHGNTSVLSHERILTKDDYNKWRNIDKMPFMVTATCDFGQFDQPSFVSSGEELMLKSDGGVIATLTTTHLVYAYANEILNREFLSAQFEHINGRWNTFGDAMRIGKNGTYSKASSTSDVVKNFRKFALLGDPALEPNFPRYFIHTTSVKDGATGTGTNTIGALGEYIIDGEVTDVNGSILTDFNGVLAVTIFDKARTVKTITPGIDKTFRVLNNTIYKGKATVDKGKFSFAFIAPKDINYEMGNGTISFYADDGETDAAGRDTTVKVGGYSDNPIRENDAPVVKPFIKDSLFINGGLTGTNTAIFAILEDETGINVSGNSIGHDLVAILDGDVSKPYIMNDYYETAPNTYKRGYVYFPVDGIPDGRHRFTVKAWDVNNNSGEGYVDFEVANGEIVKVKDLMNYPNPFKDQTHFVFEHNQPDVDLSAEINIYTTSGVWVRNLKQNFITTGSHSNEITWDGTDNNGAKLPAGMYIYRMMIATEDGIKNTAYQKLVIVR
ncbi:MAG: type IX secretion system sortase PorU [Chitinophagales bacterium]|nr:type IX secretion system sortase PorU [Chitinophagales bacterium]